MTWQHRADLDGLRTLAVYLVVLFHAGIGWLDGGYVGVDLFFVLSGFLISSILLDELHRTGRIGVLRFYARRVRRLLPAAIVVVVATCSVFVLVAPVVRRLAVIGDAQAALLYVANWRFIIEANDYFGAALDDSPFLHFWSLAIEEQFYIVFPLLLLLLFRAQRHWRPALPVGIAVLMLASLADQLLRAGHDLNYAYYATDTRIYQLLAGVLVALLWRRRRLTLSAPHQDHGHARDRGPSRGYRLLPLAGLVLLGLTASSITGLDPSWRGVLATIASAAIILGLMGTPGGLVARALARPIPAYLGRISYGTYLWHWPIIVVLGIVADLGPRGTAVLAGVFSTALAALSFEILETPIRQARRLATRRVVTVSGGVVCSLSVALLLIPPVLESPQVPVLTRGPELAATLTDATEPVPDGVKWRRYKRDRGPANTYCTPEDLSSCIVHKARGGLRVALVGDSHARVLAPAMQDLAEEHGFTLALSTVNACSWQLGVYRAVSTPEAIQECDRVRTDLYESVLDELDVDVVVLAQVHRDSGSWRKNLRSTTGGKESLEKLNLRTIAQTVTKARAKGRQVIMITSMLTPRSMDPLECLSGAQTMAECAVPVPLEPPRSDSYYKAIADATPRVNTVDVNPVMCPAQPVCEPMTGGIPVWRDSVHYAPKALQAHRDQIWERLSATGAFDRG